MVPSEIVNPNITLLHLRGFRANKSPGYFFPVFSCLNHRNSFSHYRTSQADAKRKKRKRSHKIDDLPVCGELLVRYFSDTLQQS